MNDQTNSWFYFLPCSAALTSEAAAASRASCPTWELGESRTWVSDAALVQWGASISLSSRPLTSRWTNTDAEPEGFTEGRGGGAPQLIDRCRWWVKRKSYILHVCCLQPKPSSPGFYCPRVWFKSGMMIILHNPPCTLVSAQKTQIQNYILKICK